MACAPEATPNICTLVIDSNKNVAATFNLIPVNQTHLECISNTCTIVQGNGTNQCSPAGSPCGNQTNLPDLIILSQIINVANNETNQTNYTVTITAYVKNQGNANAGASTTRFLVQPIGIQDLVSTPSINAGQSVAVSKTYTLSTGSYTLTNNADWNNTIQESNETNNAKIKVFYVPG